MDVAAGRKTLIRCLTYLLVLTIVASSGCAAGATSKTDIGPGGGEPGVLTVSSTAFAEGETIPTKYCATGVDGGRNTSPSLAWSTPPEGTRSILIAMIDQHPIARRWVHWVVADVAPSVTAFTEGASGSLSPPARELENTSRGAGYSGPEPPDGSGYHEYVVTVYALDIDSPVFPSAPTAASIAHAVDGHTLASGTLTGIFER